MESVYFDPSADAESIRRCYQANGVVVIRNLIDHERIAGMREVTRKVVYARAKSAGIELPEGLDMDEAFNRMCAVDRKLGGNVYECLRHHPGAVKLLADRAIVSRIEQLLGTEDVYYATDQTQFRIDRKNENHFGIPWHQDYWWTNTSKSAITVWYSLVDVTPEMGPMRFLLGSHKQVAKIRIDPNYKLKWDMNKLFTIAEPVDESLGTELGANAGDVIFLNALVLHRSGINLTDRNRWTVVTRYADMFDPHFVANGWKSGVRVGYLSLLDTDPSCIVNLDEVVEPA